MGQTARIKASPEPGISFEDYLSAQKLKINEALKRSFVEPIERVEEAAAYSLFLASKRIRPIFCLETCKALCGFEDKAVAPAVAIEMIHTYSLIHDDLPCMDDDDLRRGMPTNHKKFGEARAILAGDGLLTKAFEVLASDSEADAESQIKMVKELAEAAGMRGMVLGQDLDIEADEQQSLESLERLHSSKTGALLTASVVLGGIAARATPETLEQLRAFAYDMGLAFQIQDDVLDVVGGQEIGKPVKSDEKNHKLTYVSLLGIEQAKRESSKWYESALAKLSDVPFAFAHRLEELTRFVVERKF